MSLTVADALDYKGFPADRSNTGGWIPAALILGDWHIASATKLPQLRPAPCNRSAAPHACKPANGFQMGILYLTIYVIELGTGGLKSSVSGFGTDQFDEKDEKERSQMAYFFNRYKKSLGSPIVQIFQVLVAAMNKRKMEVPYSVELLYEDIIKMSRILHTDRFRFLDKAAIVGEGDFERYGPNPWKLCSVTRVEEVKMMVGLLPISATTIIFWTTYAQMMTFSVEQASTMERSIRSFQIPAGSLTVFFVAAILITLAVYDHLVMPFWKKLKGKPGFSHLQRMAIGLVLSTLGMAAAAIAEFFLVGAGEAFSYTGQLDFFITQSPKGMKTMSTGLFLSTLSLGFFVSSLLVAVVKSVTRSSNDDHGWLADNINHGRLDCFYGLLAVLGVINFVLFLVSSAGNSNLPFKWTPLLMAPLVRTSARLL
ncbi:Protein NRT1/ PTR FAMILY 6.2 [Hibiscus syriacus]|uniref:Protein NRT1/ PTR FAMILY 6.2 n=1 Tax=Hibiscus syriacus TaxID=106335 RepID=A0A6A3D806_HIBSY|nr:Protein NRT1/ PTR FAMILY 6.2 [Hibiscus syriacus]